MLHRCDQPTCVNPAHLFLGTHIDNMTDMKRKGRQPRNGGARNPNAKLTPQQVVAIRARYVDLPNFTRVAAEFGVSNFTVTEIVRRKAWPNVA